MLVTMSAADVKAFHNLSLPSNRRAFLGTLTKGMLTESALKALQTKLSVLVGRGLSYSLDPLAAIRNRSTFSVRAWYRDPTIEVRLWIKNRHQVFIFIRLGGMWYVQSVRYSETQGTGRSIYAAFMNWKQERLVRRRHLSKREKEYAIILQKRCAYLNAVLSKGVLSRTSVRAGHKMAQVAFALFGISYKRTAVFASYINEAIYRDEAFRRLPYFTANATVSRREWRKRTRHLRPYCSRLWKTLRKPRKGHVCLFHVVPSLNHYGYVPHRRFSTAVAAARSAYGITEPEVGSLLWVEQNKRQHVPV